MRQITSTHLTAFMTDHQPPCVSLYQPTHRRHPDNQNDPIRYRNLLREMEASLHQKYPKRDSRTLLENFQRLSRDNGFWNHRTEGLAILGSPDVFEIFELQLSVPELLIVADSFHTKPLLASLQAADRYQILALNRHKARLYEGNRDALDEIELAEGVPRTIEEALGGELTEPHLTVASYGGAGRRGGGQGVPSMHHGHGQKKDEVEIDNERFFRVIDRAILEHHSQPSGLPLMLAALPEHHALFRRVSHNPFLMNDGICLDTQALSADQLRQEAWKKVEPLYTERLTKLIENYRIASSQNSGSEDLAEVAQATLAGRVGVLLVERDRQIPGKIDATGRFERGDLSHPEIDDVLDDLAEITLRMKGEVVVVPTEHMPSRTGIAAIYRF